MLTMGWPSISRMVSPGMMPAFHCRGLIQRRGHPQGVEVGVHFRADAGEDAADLLVEAGELVGADVDGVRVLERFNHRAHGGLDHPGLIRFLHVIGNDLVADVDEQFELVEDAYSRLWASVSETSSRVAPSRSEYVTARNHRFFMEALVDSVD